MKKAKQDNSTVEASSDKSDTAKTLTKVHDYDAAWKSILEAFEQEVVEVIFPKIYTKIAWELGTEALDKELAEIQKEIFDKASGEKVISDKIIKVKLKDNTTKILFIHVEVQSCSTKSNAFGERMFRYFYRIWDRFRYKYEDTSEIIAAAIYTYNGKSGKDKKFVYKPLELKDKILEYNFKTIDIQTMNPDSISDDNPLKLVFKIAKTLLKTGSSDQQIYEAKIKLAEELRLYKKVKNMEQSKALIDFLEYLFLIQSPELEHKYGEYKKEVGGVFKMSIDEIRRIHYTQEGEEKGVEKGIAIGEENERIKTAKEKVEMATKMLNNNESIEKTIYYSGLSVEKILKLEGEKVLILNDEQIVQLNKIIDDANSNTSNND